MAAMVMLGFTGCDKEESVNDAISNDINATIEIEEETTRMTVDPSTLNASTVYNFWNPGDEIGVFTSKSSETNLKYVNTSSTNSRTTTFSPAQGVTVNGTPRYAYYPYSAEAGTNRSSLAGEIPTQQEIAADGLSVPGKYLYGYHSSTSSGVSKFSFKHLFATVRFHLNAEGTELAGEKLTDIDLEINRSGSAV